MHLTAAGAWTHAAGSLFFCHGTWKVESNANKQRKITIHGCSSHTGQVRLQIKEDKKLQKRNFVCPQGNMMSTFICLGE